MREDINALNILGLKSEHSIGLRKYLSDDIKAKIFSAILEHRLSLITIAVDMQELNIKLQNQVEPVKAGLANYATANHFTPNTFEDFLAEKVKEIYNEPDEITSEELKKLKSMAKIEYLID